MKQIHSGRSSHGGRRRPRVVHRQLFQRDETRYFVGVVDAYDAGVAAVRGRTWVRDQFSARLVAKHDERTKIIAFAAGTFLSYRLPVDTDVAAVRIEQDPSTGRVTLTDDRSILMDLTEHLYEERAA